MGLTITEKIIAKHAGRTSVTPGETVWVSVDLVMTHDVCGPPSFAIMEREFGSDAPVFDKEKVILIPDHFIFTKDPASIRNVDLLRGYAKRKGIKYFYDPANETYRGVCHVGLPQAGHCRPGELAIGTDSHTCTYGAFGEFSTGVGNTDAGFVLGTGKFLLKVPKQLLFLFEGELPKGVMGKDIILTSIGRIGSDGATYCSMEFRGSAIRSLCMDERMTICNMAVEAGAKNGIIAPDEKTREYLKGRTDKPYTEYQSDPDASYAAKYEFKAEELVPVVAKPYSPGNVCPAKEVAGTPVTQVYIGSCTGGKTADFRAAAEVLKGRKVKIRTIITPATKEVAASLDTEKVGGETLRQIFEAAGCDPIQPPSCGACMGGPIDTYGRTMADEVVVSTTNRNFPGRMGSMQSQVYLASPYTAAATALFGVITDPREVL
ncbi:3-isopropylmalate dehydratase large subunit [bacterium]|nr:3-isopropylmalate dehydratase large subunit [bacterium]